MSVRLKPLLRAILGPTNTGKTHYAVERMLAHSSGMMGFPLRLLAREVYDRVVAVKGVSQVALLTGEEKILPAKARYYLCTAEAMPRHQQVDFVAIDEIQMASDPERGHVFTDHLLYTRGRFETLFLGAETMRGVIKALVEGVEFVSRPRLSSLSYVRPARLARLPRRSAIVGFSASDVYGMAELIKRSRGGTAIVMGGLSPRTRNRQVAMYQSGEVDYLVATDAIGMGLNMDIQHVAFSSLTKFDGVQFRALTPAEAAQIAGRAGRYKENGSFSTLGGSEEMDPLMVGQIEDHTFEPVKKLVWRSRRLDFTTPTRLIRSLESGVTSKQLVQHRGAGDLLALKILSADPDIAARLTRPDQVQRLWDVAQVPDFRKVSPGDHHNLLARLYMDLSGPAGVIDEDFIAGQVKRLDNISGDIDTLASRIASIRVWTYVSHRPGWLKDNDHWASLTRSVEDKLSDALHDRLTQRFVDKRTAVLMRALKQRGELSVSIDEKTHKISVEGHEIGDLRGFSFLVDTDVSREEKKTLTAAAETALKAEILRRAKLFSNVGVKTLQIDLKKGLTAPRLVWEEMPFATLTLSGAAFAPRVKLLEGTLLDGEAADLVLAKCQDWLDVRVAEKLDPLLRLARELNGEEEAPEGTAPLSGLVRGVAYRLLENYGVISRADVDADMRQLDQEQRKALRRFGIRIGATSLYIPFILKPHATELRLMMWAMERAKSGGATTSDAAHTLPDLPTPGMVWCEQAETAPALFYTLAGFVPAGSKAVRMDMLERLADAVRPLGQKGGWFEVTPEIMGLVGLSGEDFAAVMKTVGYRSEIREVPAQNMVQNVAEAAEVAPESNPQSVLEATLETTAETPEEVASAAIDPAEQQEATSPESPLEAEEKAPEATEQALEALETGDADVGAENAGVKDVDVPQLVERHFFQWAPKHVGRPRPQNARRAPSDAETDGQKSGDGTKGRSARRGKLQNFNYKSDQKSVVSGTAAQNTKGQPAGRRPQREKVIDPDSPFAALAGLKEQLNQKK